MFSWRSSLEACTDPARLLAFAAHCAESARRTNRELDEAQRALRMTDPSELDRVRQAVTRVADEAKEIIAEQRFFGNSSVSTEGWEDWWVALDAPPEVATEPAPRPQNVWSYYVETFSSGSSQSSGPYSLEQAVKAFHQPLNSSQSRVLTCDGNPDPNNLKIRDVAYYHKGSKYWSGYEDTTPEEFAALRGHT